MIEETLYEKFELLIGNYGVTHLKGTCQEGKLFLF